MTLRPNPVLPGHPIIVIDGTYAGGTDGLRISAGGSIIRGLVIDNFVHASGVSGIHLVGAGGNVIAGCYVGTDATGKAAAANYYGIHVDNSPGNTIGGTSAGQGDLVSGNLFRGILIDGSASSNNIVVGSFIGTDVTGTVALTNGYEGVTISGSSANTIGGTSVAVQCDLRQHGWSCNHERCRGQRGSG